MTPYEAHQRRAEIVDCIRAAAMSLLTIPAEAMLSGPDIGAAACAHMDLISAAARVGTINLKATDADATRESEEMR